MTSSRKPSSSSSKRRRSTFDRTVLRRMLVIGGCIAAFGMALYAFFVLSPVRLDPQAARASVERSVALLGASNPTGARDAALAAVRSDPNSADAHLALARAQLLLGDGLGAEAEIKRATDAGFDARLVHHLTAHALVLQGKFDQALVEVEKTNAANRPYGLRIRGRALAGLGNLPDARDAFVEAVRIAPKDAQVWTDLGRFRLVAGDLSGAIEASARAVDLDKNNIEALTLRGELVRNQYGLTAALPWFESALKRDPAYHDALIEYAATLGDAGRSVDMLAATRRALAAKPGSAQAYYLQAVLAARAGNYDLARSLAEKTGGIIDGVPGMLLLGGTLDLQSGAYEQAIEKLRQLTGMQPTNITARKLLAVALLRTDAARNAIDVLAPVVARGDADSYALILAARGYERIGDRNNAARLLDRAAWPDRAGSVPFASDDIPTVLAGPAAEDPNNPDAVIPYIRALIASGDRDAALARAQEMARANPGAPGSHIILGDMWMTIGRPADAATEYKAAADLRFDEPVLLRLIEALEASGNRAGAASALALFLSQNPENVSALRIAAHWQLASGEYDSAIDTLEGLHLRLGNRDAALNAELAMAYAGAGENDTAEDYGSKAYTLAPGNSATADAYGWALFQGGDNQGALDLLQKASVLTPKHSGIRWHLAQVYAELKRNPEAKAEIANALADPAFADRAAAQVLLGKLN
jgi:tetratricopeptide (TPR) repeat protein